MPKVKPAVVPTKKPLRRDSADAAVPVAVIPPVQPGPKATSYGSQIARPNPVERRGKQ